MSTGSDDFTLLRSYRMAAINAVAAGDFATAINQALAAQAVLATMPADIDRGMASGIKQKLAWSTEAIDKFIVRCIQQQGAAQGVTAQNNQYVSPIGSTNQSVAGDWD
jgi:hypothetical protein